MMFARDYNDILNEYLTHINNMSPIEQFDVTAFKVDHPDLYAAYVRLCKPDTSIGSINFIRGSAFAAMYWGLLKSLDTLLDQFFYLTANRKNKERNAAEIGILSIASKTDAELNTAIAEVKQAKQMGGNSYDYEAWSKEVLLDIVKVVPTSIINSGFAGYDEDAISDEDTIDVAWSTDSVLAGSTITFDFGSFLRDIIRLDIYTTGAGLSTTYQIEYSDDNVSYSMAAVIIPSSSGLNTVSWETVGEHRYWRLNLQSEQETGPSVTDVRFYVAMERVLDAKVYKIPQGEGTFDVVIKSNLYFGVPSQDLLNAVYALLADRRTVNSGFDWGMRVLGPTVQVQNITITGNGSNWNRSKTLSDVIYYISNLQVGQTLYRTQLTAIAIQNGADTATCTFPSADVVPTVDNADGIYGLIRPGVVTVI